MDKYYNTRISTLDGNIAKLIKSRSDDLSIINYGNKKHFAMNIEASCLPESLKEYIEKKRVYMLFSYYKIPLDKNGFGDKYPFMLNLDILTYLFPDEIFKVDIKDDRGRKIATEFRKGGELCNKKGVIAKYEYTDRIKKSQLKHNQIDNNVRITIPFSLDGETVFGSFNIDKDDISEFNNLSQSLGDNDIATITFTKEKYKIDFEHRTSILLDPRQIISYHNQASIDYISFMCSCPSIKDEGDVRFREADDYYIIILPVIFDEFPEKISFTIPKDNVRGNIATLKSNGSKQKYYVDYGTHNQQAKYAMTKDLIAAYDKYKDYIKNNSNTTIREFTEDEEYEER